MLGHAGKANGVIPAVVVLSASIALIYGLSIVQRTTETKKAQGDALIRGAATERKHAGESAGSGSAASGGYGAMPITFTANLGQAGEDVKFTAQGHGYQLALMEGEAVVMVTPDRRSMDNSGNPETVRLKLMNSNRKAELAGVEKLEGVSNYLFGNDPSKWQLSVPTYAKVRYEGVYPGVDLVYYGNEGKLEYDFVVSPGADAGAISLEVEGGDRVRCTAAGDLSIETKQGALSLLRPTVYQVKDGKRELVDAQFEIASDNKLGFKLGGYDRSRELVIDPVLKYSTFLGGSSLDGGIYEHGFGYPSVGQGIAVDSKGEAVAVGATYSTNFPTANAFQSSFGVVAGNRWVAYITKFNASGSGLIYSTFLGGSTPSPDPFPANSTAAGVVVDGTGAAYVTGMTGATDFPVKGAYQSKFGGQQDAYVAKFSPTGGLVYSTYIGGKNRDQSRAIGIDKSGNAYITGWTDGGFPMTAGSFHPSTQGGIFVASVNASGSALRYSGMLGGVDQNSVGFGIAVDGSGNAYVTGMATSILTAHAFQPNFGGGQTDAFVSKINSTGSGLVYSTYLGGTGRDVGNSIVVDSSGEAYVGGTIWGVPGAMPPATFPLTSNAFSKQFVSGTGSDGFITKLSASGGLLYSSFFGGGEVLAVAVDKFHTMFFGGYTTTPSFPQFASLTPYGAGGLNAFVSTLVPSGTQGKSISYYSTLLTVTPGSPNITSVYDQVLGIAVDSSLNAYVTGYSWNAGFPTTKGAFHTVARGQSDAFVSKLAIAADLGLANSASPVEGFHGGTFTYTLTAHNTGPDFAVNVVLSDPIPSGAKFLAVYPNGGTCSAPPVNGTGTLSCNLPRLDKGGTWSVQLVIEITAASGSSILNKSHVQSSTQDLVSANNSSTLTNMVN
jgi:Domain of unknown function DUF11/Beta-propeller repeat